MRRRSLENSIVREFYCVIVQNEKVQNIQRGDKGKGGKESLQEISHLLEKRRKFSDEIVKTDETWRGGRPGAVKT